MIERPPMSLISNIPPSVTARPVPLEFEVGLQPGSVTPPTQPKPVKKAPRPENMIFGGSYEKLSTLIHQGGTCPARYGAYHHDRTREP